MFSAAHATEFSSKWQFLTINGNYKPLIWAKSRLSVFGNMTQAWALNRYYDQSRIPQKDAIILSRLPDAQSRKIWRQRIEDHDGAAGDEGGIARWLRLAEGAMGGSFYMATVYIFWKMTRIAMSIVTEHQKMLAGEFYDALDADLVARRIRAKDLLAQMNGAPEADVELRRRVCLELFGKGGDSVWLQPPFYCDYGENIEMGERVYFNFNCVVLDVCRVRIGDYSFFGPGVQILTPLHPMDAALRRKLEYGKPIDIGSDVWVGGGALILAGVSIGSGSVIGAGSVVSKDVPPGVLAVGNPCRVIRELAPGARSRHEPLP